MYVGRRGQVPGIKGGGTVETTNRYKVREHHKRSTDGIKGLDGRTVILQRQMDQKLPTSAAYGTRRPQTSRYGKVQRNGEATDAGKCHGIASTVTTTWRQPVLVPTSNRRRRDSTNWETSRTQLRSTTTTHTHGATSNTSLGAIPPRHRSLL